MVNYKNVMMTRYRSDVTQVLDRCKQRLMFVSLSDSWGLLFSIDSVSSFQFLTLMGFLVFISYCLLFSPRFAGFQTHGSFGNSFPIMCSASSDNISYLSFVLYVCDNLQYIYIQYKFIYNIQYKNIQYIIH